MYRKLMMIYFISTVAAADSHRPCPSGLAPDTPQAFARFNPLKLAIDPRQAHQPASPQRTTAGKPYSGCVMYSGELINCIKGY